MVACTDAPSASQTTHADWYRRRGTRLSDLSIVVWSFALVSLPAFCFGGESSVFFLACAAPALFASSCIHTRKSVLYDRFCVSCVIELPKIVVGGVRVRSPRLMYAAPVLVWLEARRTRGVRSSPVRRKSVQDTELN